MAALAVLWAGLAISAVMREAEVMYDFGLSEAENRGLKATNAALIIALAASGERDAPPDDRD
jgi:hypothetical protein